MTDDGLLSLTVKFGNSIDQDDSGALWEEETTENTSILREIEWDIDLSEPNNIQEIIDALGSDTRPIYRAGVSLGSPRDSVLQPITRKNSPENEIDYTPDTLSLEIGPIKISDLYGEIEAHVGWISIAFSGYGYLFPWTFREVVSRLTSSPEIQRITETCRSFWPVPSKLPEPQIVEVRKELEELWPYENFSKPWNWYWGLNTG